MTDKELLRVATQFRKGLIPNGRVKDQCFVVSSSLQGFLAAGLQTELSNGYIVIGTRIHDHYWLTLPDGRILDATGSQFNETNPEEKHLPEVYIGPKPGWFQLYKKTKKPRRL